jgi:hypothetical protein
MIARFDKAGQRAQPKPGVLADYLREFIQGMPVDTLRFTTKRTNAGRLYQALAIFKRGVDRAARGTGSRCATLL